MAEQFRSAPSPPPDLPPSLPISLFSLPTEVLVLILDNIPRHPSWECSASLARICLINKFFLSIAQPLLYRDVHLNLERDFEEEDSPHYQLFTTLTTTRIRSNLVKDLRVSFLDRSTTRLDMIAFAYVLSQIGPLASVRTSWWHARGGGYLCDLFAQAILRHQKGLKRLEIPTVTLEYDTFASVFTTLSDLDTFIGDLVPPPRSKEEERFEPICKLRRLVVTSPIDPPSLLQQVLSSSHTTLTSLAFQISTYDDPFDLSPFPHLAHVRLLLVKSRRRKSRAVPATDRLMEDVLNLIRHTVRRTLISLQATRVKTLSISTRHHLISGAIYRSPLLDILPSSLVHLSAAFPFLHDCGTNRNLFFEGVRDNAYPHLKRLSVLPTAASTPYSIRAAIRQDGKKHGVQVVIVRKGGHARNSRLDLDPWQTDSETESEDSSSDSDSTSDSSDSSETSSDSSDSSTSSISTVSTVSTDSTRSGGSHHSTSTSSGSSTSDDSSDSSSSGSESDSDSSTRTITGMGNR